MINSSRRDLARQMVNILPGFGHWANGIRDFQTPYGKLGTRQVAILWILRHDVIPAERLSPTRIAEYHHIQPSVITRALAKLEEGGFIERAIDNVDRRRTRLHITERGVEASEYVENLYIREMMAGIRDLGDEQIANLAKSMDALQHVVQVLGERGIEGELGQEDEEEVA